MSAFPSERKNPVDLIAVFALHTVSGPAMAAMTGSINPARALFCGAADDEMTCSSLGRGEAGPIDRMPGCLPDAFRRVARTCTWPAVASHRPRATLRMVRTALHNAQLESDLCPAAANPNRSDACLNSTGSKAVKIKGRKPI